MDIDHTDTSLFWTNSPLVTYEVMFAKIHMHSRMHSDMFQGSSFIRCLKPNLKMESCHFIGGQILNVPVSEHLQVYTL